MTTAITPRWRAIWSRNGVISSAQEREPGAASTAYWFDASRSPVLYAYVTEGGTTLTPPEPPPPPPQIGEQVTGQQANAQAGFQATNLKKATEALDSIRAWSEQYSAEELEDMGLTVGTGAAFKSAMAEVPSIVAALEATTFLKKLWGMGI